jgi:hypothetical protein
VSLLAQTPRQAVDPPAAATGAPLESLKVPELRDRCKALNLPHSGVKAVLVARLGSERGTPARQPPDPTTPREPAPTVYIAIRASDSEVQGALHYAAGARITVTGEDVPGGRLFGRLQDGSTGFFYRRHVRDL